MKNDFFLHRFSSNNLKDFNETLAFDVDFGGYSLLLHVEKQHEFFVFSSEAIIDHNNYYGISSARQVRVEGTRKINLKHNGYPLKLDLGHYLITINLEDFSMWVKNITHHVNHYDRNYVDNIDYQEQLFYYVDETLNKRIFGNLNSELFWSRHNSTSNDSFLLFAHKFFTHLENGNNIPDDEKNDEFNHELDKKIQKNDIEPIINKYEELKLKEQIKKELKKYLKTSAPILQLLNGVRKKVTFRDFYSLNLWMDKVFILKVPIDNAKDERQYISRNDIRQLQIDIYDTIINITKLLSKTSRIIGVDKQTEINNVYGKRLRPLEYYYERCETYKKKNEKYALEANEIINIIFFYMSSPFVSDLEKHKIVEDIRNSQFAKDIQRKYNDFCATFQIPNEHKFSYEDVATTILKDSDFQHYYYEKETCNFDLTIYQIEKLYSLLRDGKYVVEDCDIRNLSCALTGKYDGDMVFKKIRWQNTHDSLALMIGLLQDKASSTSSKFHWKNLDGLFIIDGVDVDGIKLNVAYNRYKRQPPKKRKEMERIIDKILSLNETVGKENEEN